MRRQVDRPRCRGSAPSGRADRRDPLSAFRQRPAGRLPCLDVAQDTLHGEQRFGRPRVERTAVQRVVRYRQAAVKMIDRPAPLARLKTESHVADAQSPQSMLQSMQQRVTLLANLARKLPPGNGWLAALTRRRHCSFLRVGRDSRGRRTSTHRPPVVSLPILSLPVLRRNGTRVEPPRGNQRGVRRPSWRPRDRTESSDRFSRCRCPRNHGGQGDGDHGSEQHEQAQSDRDSTRRRSESVARHVRRHLPKSRDTPQGRETSAAVPAGSPSPQVADPTASPPAGKDGISGDRPMRSAGRLPVRPPLLAACQGLTARKQ